MRYLFAIATVVILIFIGIHLHNETKISTVKDCIVKDLIQQQHISGSKESMSTEFRYLVVTDKGTFIVESSVMNGKFDNSNIFFQLKRDSVYSFKVSGVGKGWIFDYQNILEVQ